MSRPAPHVTRAGEIVLKRDREITRAGGNALAAFGRSRGPISTPDRAARAAASLAQPALHRFFAEARGPLGIRQRAILAESIPPIPGKSLVDSLGLIGAQGAAARLAESYRPSFDSFAAALAKSISVPTSERVAAALADSPNPAIRRRTEIVTRPKLEAMPVVARHLEIVPAIPAGPTPWPVVNAEISALLEARDTAVTEAHYNTVGLLCRRLLIQITHFGYDEDRHLPPGEKPPAVGDPQRIEHIISACGGRPLYPLRAAVRPLNALAENVKHTVSADGSRFDRAQMLTLVALVVALAESVGHIYDR